jgi:cytochrome c-type biogenesis protein
MIAAFVEGVTQSLLPCSWIVLFTAILIGLTRPTPRVLVAFAAASVLFAWLAVAGWAVLNLALSGILMLGGGLIWWSRGSGIGPAALVGAGAASAWQPCVGPQLGSILNLAQADALRALPGLASFIVGIIVVGAAIGWGAARLLGDRAAGPVNRIGAIVSGVIGLVMLLGLYPAISSALVSWSYRLWA